MQPALDYDEIAARIHGYYLEAKPEGAKDYEEFARLPEFMKVDNREAAYRIGEVLAMAGLRLERRDGVEWTVDDQKLIRQAIEEQIHLLAEAEHDGWTNARLRHGWIEGKEKDVDRREHHLLVPYSRFKTRIQQRRDSDSKNVPTISVEEETTKAINKDKDSVHKYVDIIARTQYRIVVEDWDDFHSSGNKTQST